MQSPLSRYTMIARRWAWLIVLGIIVCGAATYGISKIIPPTYAASSTINVLSVKPTANPDDDLNASQIIAPTYAQLIANPQVLQPVVDQHQELTLRDLQQMVVATPQSNSTLIKIDVEAGSPDLAAQLADEVGRSFIRFVSTQFPNTKLSLLPAAKQLEPVKPKPYSMPGWVP